MAPRFVVQLHDATSLHFDLRLQAGDVLRSWAVPKGPSLDPAVRRLAVPVEDHSLSAGDFEGVHQGQSRGTGAVIIWDEGTADIVRDEPGHLSFILSGHKLAGRFALTRTGERRWLLIKVHDDHARPGSDIVAERPASVRSSKTWQEVSQDRQELSQDRQELSQDRQELSQDPAGAVGGIEQLTATAEPDGRADSTIREASAGMGAAREIFGRLADGEVVIMDGGTGTALQAAGVPMDDDAWSGRANLDHLEMVQAVHEAYIRAGAQVIIANTFAANRAALEPAGLGARVDEANRNAVTAALTARAAAAGRAVAIAGSMSSFCPVAMHGRAAAGGAAAAESSFPSLADYRGQAALLADSGVDLIALELMESPGYGRAAIQAATETGLPVWLGISPIRRDDGTLGTDPELGSGESFEELLRLLADPGLAAVNVMHAKPDVVPDAIDAIRRYFAGPIGVYAESGDWAAPNWVFNGLSPDEYLREAAGWVRQGAQIIGGCCGVGPEHIAVLADRLA